MSTDAQQASVTSLTYAQLIEAMAASNAEQDTRLAAFDAACRAAHDALRTGNGYREARAEMDGWFAAVRAQAAMTRAIAGEITARIRRHDYA